jgi:anti-sigma B factor antagonist
MSSELVFREEFSESAAKVVVSGEIDIYTAQLFKEKLYHTVDKSDKDLVVDCSNLNYIDSTGLGIFVGALKKIKQKGKNIFIENVRDNIRKLFVITGLDKLFILR